MQISRTPFEYHRFLEWDVRFHTEIVGASEMIDRLQAEGGMI